MSKFTSFMKRHWKAITVGGVAVTGAIAAGIIFHEYNIGYSSDIWADFGGDVGKVWNNQVADLVVKHSRLIDRLNPRKMTDMIFTAFDMLNGAIVMPEGDDWNILTYFEEGFAK